jgi:DNA-binding transcriptional LysR family regulator
MDDMNTNSSTLNLLLVPGVLFVSKASMRLNLTQAAVSVHLLKLRAHFEDELPVLHPGRKVELTELAMRLIDMRSSFEPGKSTRRFSIATTDAKAAVILTRLSRRLATEAPGVQISFVRSVRVVLWKERRWRISSNRIARISSLCRAASIRDAIPLTCFTASPVSVVCADNPLVGATLSEAQYPDLTHVVRVFGEDE